ncbi:MAG: multicopper oxidase domain-containing protein [Methylocystis sp.]
MKKRVFLNRRGFLSSAALAAASLAVPDLGRGEMSMKKIPPNQASDNFHADVDLELVAKPGSAPILPGGETNVWRYSAKLLTGPDDTLAPISNSYLGPVLRFAKGQKIRIRLRNELPEQHITHWHGLHVPHLMDGHPNYAIDRGETFVYEFEMLNRAGMHIYHPHPHEATATQVYRGLAGAIIVSDDEERALGLPSGEFELPVVIQDRTFNDANQLIYGGGMHMSMFGFYGERILVNGRADAHFDVASRAYRLRVMNASNARIYKLAWDDGTPVTVLGVDGGLLEAAETRPYVMLAPGERLDVWADFSGRAVGSKLTLRSARFLGALPRMAERMGGMTMESELPPGGDYPIAVFNVARAGGDGVALPRSLAKIARRRAEDAANANNPAAIRISEAPMSMLLNGQPYDDDIQPGERFPVNNMQIIDIFHDHRGGGMGGMGMGGMGMGRGMMGGGMMGGGMGMMFSMRHPIHLHGQQFQIVSRVFEGRDEAYDTVRDGFVDSGLKDTVLVSPGEQVRILKPFDDFKGRFMFHCHILEHEDMGMMRQFLVE